MRLDAQEITERARGAAGPDGRLALPHTAHWPIFPFVTDGLRVTEIRDPVLPEPPRRGEGGVDCPTCQTEDEAYVWAGRRWRISMATEPMALPSAVIHPRAHLDFGDLTEDQGAELGVMLVRTERALAAIDGVGSVHVYKWGDGGAHLHVVVVARPAGVLQLKGMFLSTWLHILPPLPGDTWAAMRAHLGDHLATATRR